MIKRGLKTFSWLIGLNSDLWKLDVVKVVQKFFFVLLTNIEFFFIFNLIVLHFLYEFVCFVLFFSDKILPLRQSWSELFGLFYQIYLYSFQRLLEFVLYQWDYFLLDFLVIPWFHLHLFQSVLTESLHSFNLLFNFGQWSFGPHWTLLLNHLYQLQILMVFNLNAINTKLLIVFHCPCPRRVFWDFPQNQTLLSLTLVAFYTPWTVSLTWRKSTHCVHKILITLL